jgi:hypothetical protein
MRNPIKIAAAGLVAAALSGPASAVNYYYEFNDLNPLLIGATYTSSILFHPPGDSFTDTLAFNIPASDVVAKIISFEVGSQITFGNLTGALYKGVDANNQPASCKPGCNGLGFQFLANLGGGSNSWTSNPVTLTDPGYYFVVVAGQTQIANSLGGAYVGEITISAIPEAGSWAMLLAGMGVIGLMARRRLQDQ